MSQCHPAVVRNSSLPRTSNFKQLIFYDTHPNIPPAFEYLGKGTAGLLLLINCQEEKMKITQKVKALAAVSILAIGIPAAGIAYASPGQHLNLNQPTQTQDAGSVAKTDQQLTMTPGVHNPANSWMATVTASDKTDNSKAKVTVPGVNMSPAAMPMVSTGAQKAPDSVQMPHMNIDQMNKNNQSLMTEAHKTNMSPGSGHAYMTTGTKDSTAKDTSNSGGASYSGSMGGHSSGGRSGGMGGR